MTRQVLVVNIDADTARRVRRFVAAGGHGYDSLNEFVEVALLNQLNIEPEVGGLEAEGVESPSQGLASPVSGVPKPGDTLIRPSPTPTLSLLTWIPVLEPLSAFTNRLSPVKVAVRVLANLSQLSESWPDVDHFHREAGAAARALGLRLRKRDGDRRWIGYPVGADSEKSLARFVSSFTATAHDDRLAGPLALLGFAALEDGRIGLTREGWRLAAAPNPLLDDNLGGGATLSPPEIQIFREAIASLVPEATAIEEFLRFAEEAGGVQSEIDARLADSRPSWSEGMVVAHRAAQIGRLSDLGALEVSGRGMSARIRLLPGAEVLRGNRPKSAGNSIPS